MKSSYIREWESVVKDTCSSAHLRFVYINRWNHVILLGYFSSDITSLKCEPRLDQQLGWGL